LFSRSKSTGDKPGLKLNHDEHVFFNAERVLGMHEDVFLFFN